MGGRGKLCSTEHNNIQFPFEILLTSDTLQPFHISSKTGRSFANDKKIFLDSIIYHIKTLYTDFQVSMSFGSVYILILKLTEDIQQKKKTPKISSISKRRLKINIKKLRKIPRVNWSLVPYAIYRPSLPKTVAQRPRTDRSE